LGKKEEKVDERNDLGVSEKKREEKEEKREVHKKIACSLYYKRRQFSFEKFLSFVVAALKRGLRG